MLILVVDDNNNLRDDIVEYLRRRRHEAMSCGSVAAARDALEAMLAEDRPPQGVVCDIRLPDGDGADFYLDYAWRTPSCRWILMSGAHDPAHLDSQLKGLRHVTPCIVIEKPIHLHQLQQLLEGNPPVG